MMSNKELELRIEMQRLHDERMHYLEMETDAQYHLEEAIKGRSGPIHDGSPEKSDEQRALLLKLDGYLHTIDEAKRGWNASYAKFIKLEGQAEKMRKRRARH